jgi:DNA uptake protein ComE-like DNA-binding protein
VTDRIDINAADQDAFDTVEGLRGHGHEIVRYREERGGFTSLRELDEVPGLTGNVGEATRRRLTIGQARTA